MERGVYSRSVQPSLLRRAPQLGSGHAAGHYPRQGQDERLELRHHRLTLLWPISLLLVAAEELGYTTREASGPLVQTIEFAVAEPPAKMRCPDEPRQIFSREILQILLVEPNGGEERRELPQRLVSRTPPEPHLAPRALDPRALRSRSAR